MENIAFNKFHKINSIIFYVNFGSFIQVFSIFEFLPNNG